MTKFKWNFKGYAAVFLSTDDSHDVDIFKAAKLLGIAPETKIEYHDTTINRPAIADTFAIDSNTTTNGKSAVRVDTESIEFKPETVDLSDLHGDVDWVVDTSDILSNTNGVGSLGEFGDSVVDDTDREDA
jgi:hypothetical protein